jgi:type VI secretion system protein VasD
MTRSSSAIALVAILVVNGIGCGGKVPPPPVPAPPSITIAAPVEAKIKAAMTIVAGKDANPDGGGRPSPVVVRIYQLKTDGAFSAADFDALYDDDQKALGIELISRDEFVLAPAERRTLDVAVASETRFVGAIAAFRDIRNAQWRALIPVPRTGFNVSVERARIVVSLAE